MQTRHKTLERPEGHGRGFCWEAWLWLKAKYLCNFPGLFLLLILLPWSTKQDQYVIVYGDKMGYFKNHSTRTPNSSAASSCPQPPQSYREGGAEAPEPRAAPCAGAESSRPFCPLAEEMKGLLCFGRGGLGSASKFTGEAIPI